MSYVKVLITTPKESITAAFDVEEFKKYIDNNTYSKFSTDKSFSDNFNDNAPTTSQYGLKITEETDLKPFTDDPTMNRLILAEYALNCYSDPEEVLSNISESLYKYKHLFGGRKLELNNMESIKHEKGVLEKFYKDFREQNVAYTEKKSKELVELVMEQANKQRGR